VKEFLVYTAARLAIFLVSYGVVVGIYLLVTGADQVPLIWPFLIAVVISAIASVVFLRRQREAFAQVVQRRAQRAGERFEQARSKEDDPEG
jgi:predicted neutral ceramidase superfamily lipid hydrolase